MDSRIKIQKTAFINVCFSHKQRLFWKYFPII